MTPIARPRGYGKFAQLIRCSPLKTFWFPAGLRLLSRQICTYHNDPVYESMPRPRLRPTIVRRPIGGECEALSREI